MGESKRPQQIAVYKSGAEGGFNQLAPWLYLVTELSECRNEFAVPVKFVPDSSKAILCQPYATAAAEMNENVISVSLSPSSYGIVVRQLQRQHVIIKKW